MHKIVYYLGVIMAIINSVFTLMCLTDLPHYDVWLLVIFAFLHFVLIAFTMRDYFKRGPRTDLHYDILFLFVGFLFFFLFVRNYFDPSFQIPIEAIFTSHYGHQTLVRSVFINYNLKYMIALDGLLLLYYFVQNQKDLFRFPRWKKLFRKS